MERIIGRKKEIQELQACFHSNQAEFVAIYGRRRVGKTFLVREMFKDNMVFYHTGLSPFELKDEVLINSQLTNFYSSLKRYGYEGTEKPSDWMEAFDMLIKFLETNQKEEKQVVFIDEIAWMDTPRSGFLTAFEHFWNGWASGQHHLMLITCSSAASWVLDNIINNRGGLYDRTTCEIHLSPFTLQECEQYLHSKDIQLDRYSQALSYMAIGGVPYYLSMLKKGESIAANIDNLFFAKGAKLRNEFDNLFASQFADSESLKSIVKLLTKKKEGFTRKEISELCKIKTGGAQTDMIIDRADRLINICEMKFYNTDFIVDKGYDTVLRNKLTTFMEETKVRKSPIMTLITTFGLKYNEYSGRFQSVITLEGLF